jgi:hypothetical protein
MDKTALLNAVAKRTGTPVSDIIGDSRRWELVHARRVAAVGLRELKWAYPAIGRAMGRDHSSIVHLVQTADDATRALARECVDAMYETTFTLRYVPPTSFNDSLTWIVTNPRTGAEVMLPCELTEDLSAALASGDMDG